MRRLPLAGMSNGPPPLEPLTYLVDPEPQATAEQRLGDPADPRHEQLGERARPYPWEGVAAGPHGPYGPENQMLGDTYALSAPAGYLGQDPTADLQPETRAAPWPKGLSSSPYPDDTAPALIESHGIHSSDQGVGRQMLYRPAMDAQQDHWLNIDRVDPGDTLQTEIPKQVSGYSGGYGSTDRVQSQAKVKQNAYDYGSSHVLRRLAQSSIPGNYMWMRPADRPMIHPLARGATMPTGQDSPFTGQDTGASFATAGAVLTGTASEYTSAIDPELSAPLPVQDSIPVQAWY